MNFPFYIARRYLFAKKSHNLINIISAISVIGMAVGVTALIVVLSVFNGFDQLIRKMFSNIDSDLRIELVEGKTFSDTLAELNAVRNYSGVAVFSEVLQEHALFKYRNRQHIGVIKGVSRNYNEISGVDSMIIDGEFQLWRGSQPLAIIGQGVAYYLNANLAHFDPIEVYIPKRGRQFSISAATAFNSKVIMPVGVFAIEQEFDSQFIIVPIEFARKLTNFNTEVTSVEILLKPGTNSNKAQTDIQKILGENFKVQNRYQQNESLYRTMNTEKLSIGVILSLILFIASFNIIGSLSMLIIDKRKDVETLRSLGANNDLIQKIFLTEGLLISLGGTILGTTLGLLICWLQITFKLVKLTGTGGFIVNAYPVDIQWFDIAAIILVVLVISFFTARFPVRIITKRIFAQENAD